MNSSQDKLVLSSKLILIFFFYWCFHQGLKTIPYSFWQCQESHSIQTLKFYTTYQQNLVPNCQLCQYLVWLYCLFVCCCFFVVCFGVLFVVLFLNWHPKIQNTHCFLTEILLKLWLVSGCWIKAKTVQLLNNILIIKVVCNDISYSESTGVIQSCFKSKVSSNHLQMYYQIYY